MERILKTNGIPLSVDKVLAIAKTVTTLKVKLLASGESLSKTMLITSRHKSIGQLFDQSFWENQYGDALSKSGKRLSLQRRVFPYVY
ncbi:MAG: hypothetical protein LBE91_10960 [Tannerella sp.]|nr:hypothetical protein [Tannerella sp.]